MMKKVGRNDLCPCGSGVKYKKCCLKFISKTNQFIKSSNSAKLLDFIVGLQLVPENHGKNIRIEELAKQIVQNLNYNPNCNLNLFKQYLDEEYSFNHLEDTPESLFCENVVFYGGNYNAFPGISTYSVEIFKTLTKCIFHLDNNLPDEFKNHIRGGISLILRIGQIISKKFNISGNIIGSEKDKNLNYSFELQDTSINKDELMSICYNHSINHEVIDYFVISKNDPRFLIEDQCLNPLLTNPIVEFDGRYYFVLISNQINALNEFMFKLSHKYKCNNALVSVYHKLLWSEHLFLCKRMGWKLLNDSILGNSRRDIFNERLYIFDVNKIVYSCYWHNRSVDFINHDNKVFQDDFKIGNRINEVITALRNKKESKDFKILTLINYEMMGRELVIPLEKPQENELRFTMPIHEFNILCLAENWDELSIWKYAKSYKRFCSVTDQFIISTLDNYSLYKSNENSFYLSDDKTPSILIVDPGQGSTLIKNAKIDNDEHGIWSEVNGQEGYLVCSRLVDYAPIFKPKINTDYYAICLETFCFPVWITNNQITNSRGAFYAITFAEAIAFWLFKLKENISKTMELNIPKFFQIDIVLDELFFQIPQIEELENVLDDKEYMFTLEGFTIKFFIPYGKIKSFIESDNTGESEMMYALLKAFNLIKNVELTDEFIAEIIKNSIPRSSAKRILIFDNQRDPLIDTIGLKKIRYISDDEVDRILEELPEMIAQVKQIPKSVERIEDKKDLIKLATDRLLNTLVKELDDFYFEELLNKLIEFHETLVWKRENNQIIIPAQIKCFGNLDGKLNELTEDENKLVKTTLATRCLIEYLAAKPTKGSRQVSFDDLDRFLALMSEIINYGFLSDAIHFNLTNPTIKILNSGRLGISQEFYEEKLKPFSTAYYKAEVEQYVEYYDRRFISTEHSKKDIKESRVKKDELSNINEAFLIDWGISFGNIEHFCYCCYLLCRENEKTMITMDEHKFISSLVEKYKLPEKEVVSGISRFSLTQRGDYLKAPMGYNNSEVYPWKYNREFSYIRRFIIKHINENGEVKLTWGLRNSLSAYKQLCSLFYNGKLKNSGKEIEKLLGSFQKRKGKEYRNLLMKWLMGNKNLKVINYEVEISPHGHLISDNNHGDVDILMLDPKTKIVWSIECKNTNQAKNMHELKNEIDNYIGRKKGKGMIMKHVKRHNWLNCNKDKICKFLNIDYPINVRSCIVTSEVIPTAFTNVSDLYLPIISFPDLKREGTKLLYKSSSSGK